MKTASLIIRYVVAAGAAWVLYPLQAAVLYVLLWIVAAVTNQDLGGPLAGPFIVILAGAVGLVIAGLVVVPSIAAGELAARRSRWVWTVPAALASAALLTCAVAGVWTLTTHATLTAGAIAWAISAGMTLLPLSAAGLIVAAASTTPAATRWGVRRITQVIGRT